jgi:hypothetical protein
VAPTDTERVFQKLDEINGRLVAVETKLSPVISKSDQLSSRLHKLELNVAYAFGAVGLAAFVFPYITRWLGA